MSKRSYNRGGYMEKHIHVIDKEKIEKVNMIDIEVIEEMLDNGIRAKDVAKMLSKVTNISKNEIYDFIVKNYK